MAGRRRTTGEGEVTRRRGEVRREMIVSSAAELFRKKGYPGTSIEDIGAAVGTTGPAIYRHFASKEAILVELLERAVKRSQRDVASVLEQELPPLDTLREIVRKSVDHVIEETDLVVMADQETRSLSPDMRQRMVRERRTILRGWMQAVQAVRPELSESECRAVCLSVFALIISLPRAGALPRSVARPLYIGMAMAALLAKPVP